MSKSDVVVLPVCRFDGYECFRNLCCHSRFCYPFRCSRFVGKTHFLFTPRFVKSVLKDGF